MSQHTLTLQCVRCKKFVNLAYDPDGIVSENFVRLCFKLCNDCASPHHVKPKPQNYRPTHNDP